MNTRATDDLRFVRCTAGGVTFGVEIDRIAAVERGDRLTRRPTAAGPGAIATRHGERPVFAPPGVGRTSEIVGQVVMVNGPRGQLGLWVERVSPVERVPGAAVADLPVGTGGRCRHAFSCVVLTESGPVPVLEIAALGVPSVDAQPEQAATVLLPPSDDRLLAFSRVDGDQGGRPVAVAVPLCVVAEVYDPSPGTPLPGAGDHVRELVVWRGRPLTVLDAVRWMGFAASAPSRRVVVVRCGEQAIGLTTGARVHPIIGSTPCVVGRRVLPARPDRISISFDTDEFSVVVPNVTRLWCESGDT